MKTIEINISITRDNGTSQTKRFNWHSEDGAAPNAHKLCQEWVEGMLKGEPESIAKAPKPAPYKSKGMNDQ